jgi:tetratricopeptide (TPR) repeat protein
LNATPELTPAYREIKELRSTGRCAEALPLLKSRPPANDADAFEAVVCLFVCGDMASALHVCRTYPWREDWSRDLTAALAERLSSGNIRRALSLARRAMESAGSRYDAVAIYLLLLQDTGSLEEAAQYIRSRLQNLPPGETFLLTVIAEFKLASGEWRQAYRAACAVLASDPDDYRALMVLSTANFEIGNYHESLGNAVRAAMLRPGTPSAILQLMRCRNKLGDHYNAIAAAETLSDLTTLPPEIHVERARAYSALDALDRAVEEYRAALRTASSVDAIRGLLAVFALAGNSAELEALGATYRQEIEADTESLCLLGLSAVNRGDAPSAERVLQKALTVAFEQGDALRALSWPVPEPRIRHDCEQLELLARRGLLKGGGRQALVLLKKYCEHTSDPAATFAPAGADAESLKNVLCDIFNVPDRSFAGRALGANDYAAIEEQYVSDRVVVIDDFMSHEALEALRRYCEEATIWKMSYGRGYVGATLAQGFSPEVLLQLASELRAAMPQVLGRHPLTQAWAFKYDQRMQGINMHADFADVNVNFWITPDEACEDPGTGGMVVYDVPVPANWTFFEYNNEPEKLAAYVKVHKASARRVPYKANRCVLFDSSLIHITDELHFKPGYENRRVNVTLLYGMPRNVG